MFNTLRLLFSLDLELNRAFLGDPQGHKSYNSLNGLFNCLPLFQRVLQPTRACRTSPMNASLSNSPHPFDWRLKRY